MQAPTSPESAQLHGAAAGAQPPGGRADWIIEQGWANYSAAEHALWRRLFERQVAMLPSRACEAFVRGMQALPIDASGIPDFERLSEVLGRHTGWRVVAVPGLVPDEVFFEHLANRRFPAGNFLRKPEQLDYLSEPDVFHDVFGHVPMLMNPALADYMQAYGVGGLRAHRLGVLDQLARVYWFTVEFGLVQEHGALRLYGSGIASSYRESQFCLDDDSPNRVRFGLERVMRTRYRIDDFQETYFVLDNLEQLLELARIDFGPLYERLRGLPEFEPGALQPGDEVLHRGSGRYHAGRRVPA